jgi:hypothetical protein
MAKLVFSILMVVVWWMLHALQMDEELALGTVHEAKRAVDRAVHAAAQQLDQKKLEMGIPALQREEAEAAAVTYLRENLRLDAAFMPLPGSFLREAVKVEELAVLNDNLSFPFTYRSARFGYEVTLSHPGVVMIVHVSFPRLFGVLAPVQWDLKGSAEMVYS